jgi:hypothetical protein
MARIAPVTGSDLDSLTPVNGVVCLGGIIRSPRQLVSIAWEVDGASGSTECEAWEGQYRIDRLTAAGYTIVSVKPHY